MRRAVVVPVVLATAVFGVAELKPWRGPSEEETKKEICDAFLTWLKEHEQSPEFKAAQEKSPNERTVREQTTFDAVETVRAGMGRCGKVT